MDALGMIELYGELAAVEALDSALKAACVQLASLVHVGGGLVSVFVTGDVGSVKAAMDASVAAAERVGRVIAVHVIPRPDDSVDKLLRQPTPVYSSMPQRTKEETDSSGPEETCCLEEAPAHPGGEENLDAESLTEESLRRKTVVQLRSLVRKLNIDTIARNDLRFSHKEELIKAIREFVEREG